MAAVDLEQRHVGQLHKGPRILLGQARVGRRVVAYHQHQSARHAAQVHRHGAIGGDEMLWSGAFAALPRSKVMSPFVVSRTYLYGGQVVTTRAMRLSADGNRLICLVRAGSGGTGGSA